MSNNTPEQEQIVLTQQHYEWFYERLMAVTENGQKSLNDVLRESLEAQINAKQEAERQKKEALDNLLNLEAPTADWEQMEADIEAGALDE